ncbi:lipopolysaccharide biosynthesis protein [Cellulomonas chengniuliangii]|uniref:Membrane protein involved in the export of O-antigen and teichoic acid n=1 Tax=Cellulomonas chengniuliangii TaxID=2968084 RepID=A0ABY5KZE6_9CELL|nr:hypothetical protein [Cellulomonas chengniuliangii]MCC2310075.1 hypothetical protein [Cellulomonas chengniuliangii]UUI74530.1 hypothetical protein NP064_12085 [Cellulomonas chengniuliangii]
MSEGMKVRLGYLRRHAGPFATVGVVSVVGIIATTLFHALTGRALGPEAFGLLAAFLSIVNIAAIGASAVQNSVAVATARALPVNHVPIVTPKPTRRWDGTTIEALILGGGGALIVAAFAPFLADRLATSTLAVYLAALTILPSFLFSVAQGRLQGAAKATAVAGWSTTSQVLRVLLAAGALAAGMGAVSVLVAVLAAVVAVAVAAGWQVRGARLRTNSGVFSAHSVVLILLTLTFAWLTNIDVMLVRIGAPESAAGMFAAAAVIAKMILIVPTTLSLYLLPRFVNRVGDKDTTNFGVNVIMLTVLVSGVAVALAMAVLGGPVVSIFFGSGYEDAAAILPWLSLAYLPWAMAQGLLIRLTAAGSRVTLALLAVAAVAQWALATTVLPDLRAMVGVIGGLGLVVCLLMFAVHARHHRKLELINR